MSPLIVLCSESKIRPRRPRSCSPQAPLLPPPATASLRPWSQPRAELLAFLCPMATAVRSSEDKERPDLLMLDLARRQAGVVGRKQLLDVGLTSQQIHRRVRSGILIRALPRVYRHVSAPETWIQRLWAACVWAGDRAAISHQAAGALWRFDGCSPGHVTLVTTRSLKRTNGDVQIRRVSTMPAHHLTRRHGLTVTTPTRTVLDLAAVLPEADLETALDCALRRGSTSRRRLEMELRRTSGHGHRGRGALISLLRERSPDYSPTHSVLENRFRRLLKRNGLPLPSQQEVIHRRHGGFAVVDFMYRAHGLVIEVDGYAVHNSRSSWQHDRHRQNDLVIAGLKVLRYSWRDVCNDETSIVETVRSFFSPSLPLSGTGGTKK